MVAKRAELPRSAHAAAALSKMLRALADDGLLALTLDLGSEHDVLIFALTRSGVAVAPPAGTRLGAIVLRKRGAREVARLGESREASPA
jgi:hypothetical protein